MGSVKVYYFFPHRKKKPTTKAKTKGDGDSDSRSSTPTLKAPPQSSTPSSSQDSSSDVPKKKRVRVDTTVETVSLFNLHLNNTNNRDISVALPTWIPVSVVNVKDNIQGNVGSTSAFRLEY